MSGSLTGDRLWLSYTKTVACRPEGAVQVWNSVKTSVADRREEGIGRSETQDLHENAGAGGRPGLRHDVLDVFFHRLFGDSKLFGDVFVRPALQEILNNRHLAIRQAEDVFDLFYDGSLRTTHLFHGNENP